MPESQTVAIAFTATEWRTIQEALDEYFYESEHGKDIAFTRRKREQRRAQRDERLALLKALDRKIGEQTGLGPLFG